MRPSMLSGALALMFVPAVGLSAQTLSVRAENPLGISRADETIGVPWSQVTTRLPAASAARVRVIDAGSGQEIPSQVVDDDGNGTIDELIFQASFGPRDVRRFTVEAVAPATPAKQRVFAMHTDPRDDVAWESDRIGFRIYGQGLWKVDSLLSSGMDVWVKRVRTPIVEKWYAKGHDEYHHDTGEGADFFDVGQTLGAGGTGIWANDQLYRAWNFKSWRIIANGPVRTIFELQYQAWDAGTLRVTESKRIALDAGSNLNHVVSTFRSEKGGADIPWVTGLVKRPGVIGSESKAQAWAWLTVWGLVNPKDGGHGELGTAVLLPRDLVNDWKETSDHYLALSHARSGEPVSYYVGAGWTGSGDYRGIDDWWAALNQQAQRLGAPIQVTLGVGDGR